MIYKILCFFGIHSPIWRDPETGIFLHSYVDGYTEIKCDYCGKYLIKRRME